MKIYTSRATTLVVFAAIMVSFVSQASSQACLTAGCIDDTFGVFGKVYSSINFNTGSSWANDSAIQPDGKIVVAASGSNYPAGTGVDFYVQRFLPDGTLDPDFGTFGSGGTSRITFTTTSDNEFAYAIALQTDGKIVVGGAVPAGFGIARLNADGTIDTGFGNNGKVSFNFSSKDGASARAVAVQDDGRIVALGTASDKFAFARLTTTGGLDTSFGGSGKVTISTISNKNGGSGRALAIQADGKIVAAGRRPALSGRTSTGEDFAVMRLNVNGTLDQSFGSSGKVFTDFVGREDRASAIAVDDAGKIVVGGGVKVGIATGRADMTYWRYALARYNADGTLDSTFGSGGKVTAGPTGYFGVLNDIAIQSDGKIVGAGEMHDADFLVSAASVVRFNSGGVLDSAFGPGADGIATTDLGGVGNRHSCVSIQADGKILTGGIGGPPTSLILTRYLP